MGPKTKVMARRLSPLQRPRMPLRPRPNRLILKPRMLLRPRQRRLNLRPRMLLRPWQRRQRPRPKRLILRPSMFLPPSRAKKKTPQGQEVALRTYFVVSFVVLLFLSVYIMYSLFCLMKMFFFLSLVPLLYVL